MKKQLISEAFRLQQLAGIKPIYSLKEIDKRNDTIGKIIVNNKEVDVDSIEFDSDSYNPNFDDVWITSAKFVDGTNLSDREKEDLLDDYHYELRPVIYNYLHESSKNKNISNKKPVNSLKEEDYEGSDKHLDELQLRTFIDDLGLDSDHPAFKQAY